MNKLDSKGAHLASFSHWTHTQCLLHADMHTPHNRGVWSTVLISFLFKQPEFCLEKIDIGRASVAKKKKTLKTEQNTCLQLPYTWGKQSESQSDQDSQLWWCMTNPSTRRQKQKDLTLSYTVVPVLPELHSRSLSQKPSGQDYCAALLYWQDQPCDSAVGIHTRIKSATQRVALIKMKWLFIPATGLPGQIGLVSTCLAGYNSGAVLNLPHLSQTQFSSGLQMQLIRDELAPANGNNVPLQSHPNLAKANGFLWTWESLPKDCPCHL